MVLFIIMGGYVEEVVSWFYIGASLDSSFNPNTVKNTCTSYYVNQKSVPAALQWIQEVSMIKYAFEALCINEFEVRLLGLLSTILNRARCL